MALRTVLSWTTLPLRVQWAALAWYLVVIFCYFPDKTRVWTTALAIAAVVGSVHTFNQ